MQSNLIFDIVGSRPRWAAFALAFFFSWTIGPAWRGVVAADSSESKAILQALKSLRELGSVLLIAAHPDDENNQLITYLARGRGYRMAYLSLTRGDGGQNLLGAEFREQLGVIRTQELLAARRIDGGRQYFTRAIDFGYSKDVNEALRIWDRDQVLGDVVRIVRTFRPDIIVTRFSPKASGTHGHHTGSAVLAVEAFKLAGDPLAYPEQLDKLSVWQPKRIVMNGGRSSSANNMGIVRMEVGGNDPVLGIPYAEIANASRAMHKSQGFGGFAGRSGGGPRTESFQLLDGEPANLDIMDGVDTTWGRFEGGAEIGSMIDDAIAQFNATKVSDNVPALLRLRTRLMALPQYRDDPIVFEKVQQLEHIIQSCLGLQVETLIPQAEVVPGEVLRMQHKVTLGCDTMVRWLGVNYPKSNLESPLHQAIELRPQQGASMEASQTLGVATPLSQPFWLREPGTVGMFRVDDPSKIGQAENEPAFPVEFIFEVEGQTLRVFDEPVQVVKDPTKGEIRRRMDVIPSLTLQFASEVSVFAPNATRTIEVDLTAYRERLSGYIALDAPSDWHVEPQHQSFDLAAVGDRKRVIFEVTAPPEAASTDILAVAQIDSSRYSQSRIEIRYDHIPIQILLPSARLRAVSLNLAIRGRKVGYVPGAGDSIAEALKQIGYAVSELSVDDLTAERLQELDAVVIGVRAFNVHKELTSKMPALFSFVEAGGNVIEQYNRPDRLESVALTPYQLRLSSLRITDEEAAVRFLAPEHPVLNQPNRITVSDFSGWVQERGIYFPDQWGEQFTPILASNDPNEPSLEGGLLVAKHGKGYFVYTGLTFFRQLPAGVPGAYRLFANLVSLGK